MNEWLATTTRWGGHEIWHGESLRSPAGVYVPFDHMVLYWARTHYAWHMVGRIVELARIYQAPNLAIP